MHIVIRTFDGSIHFHCEADGIDAALESMAKAQGYVSYQALCVDLKYQGRDFEVSVILDGRNGGVAEVGDLFEAQRQQLSKSAFRFMRRNA